MPVQTTYIRNPSFSAVPGTEDYPGTPRDQKNLYMNEEHVFLPKLRDVLKWQTSANPYKTEKKTDTRRLQVIPRKSLDELPDNAIIWLGHASFLIHLDGIRLLIDPVLTSSMFLKRQSELPFNTGSFQDIDYILISHNHRDHCDKESIQLLAKQNGLPRRQVEEEITKREHIITAPNPPDDKDVSDEVWQAALWQNPSDT